MAREVTQGYCKDSACAYDVYTKYFVDEKVIPHLGGVKDYEKLEKKPKINGVELTGDKALDELGILQGGIYVGDEEPTDKNINIWLDTSEEADIPTGDVTEEDLNRLEKTLQDILTVIQGGELNENQIADIEQLIVSYFETKTVKEVEE